MLGEQFHKSLTQPIIPAPTKSGRGRSADLVASRNEKLAYRYYYKATIKQMRIWDDIVRELSLEFDLAEATISRTITMTMSEFIRELFRDRPTVKELQRNFPYLVW